jgi:hypothetical protein
LTKKMLLMSTHLEQLDSTESVLLMYLSDELSGRDRAAVEQRLESDAEFAAELERTRAREAAFMAAFRDADRARKLPLKPDVAVRRVARAMHDWQMDRAAAAAATHSPIRSFRIPWWGYPAAVAASIIVGFLVWSNNQNVTALPPAPTFASNDDEGKLADELEREFDPRTQNDADQQWQELSLSSWDDTSSAVFINPIEESSQ